MPKLNLNFKDFDFKQFMVQKGERVGLWVMVGAMALLIIFGVFVNGFSRGSASGNSTDLNKLSDAGKAAMARSAPTEDMIIVGKEWKAAATLAAIDPSAVACMHPLFTIDTGVDRRWRKPDVLSPDEFQLAVMRELVKTYIPGMKGGKPAVMCLQRKDNRTKPGPGQPPMMRGAMMQNVNMLRMQGMFGNNGFNPRLMAMIGARGMGPGMPGQDDDKDINLVPVPIDELGKDGANGKDALKPAEAVVPLRIVIVQFGFPFRKQYEVFQRALRYHTIEEMEKDASVEFTGLNVERREVGIDGKPGEWKPIDLTGPQAPLRPFLAFGSEAEDPALITYGLAWDKDKMLFPRPFLARDARDAAAAPGKVAESPAHQWPAPALPGIIQTLKEIEEAAKAGQPPPPPKIPNRFSKEFDLWGGDAAGNPANGVPPAGPMPPAPMPKRPPMGGAPMAPRAQAAFGSEERLLPKKCLGRFIDVQVTPGTVYEYRIQVRMANPLHGKKDVAISQELTKDKEIVGEWTEVGQKVRIPPEGDFYFLEDPAKTRLVSSHPDRVWTQIHRWFDWVPVDPKEPRNSMTAVGEWAIADHSAVYRGEYIGRWEDTELPIWNPKLEAFVLAQHPEQYQRKRIGGVSRTVQHKGPAIDFMTYAVLVDFDGGKTELFVAAGAKGNKDGREMKIKDDSAVEALVLLPDGRLVVRDARKDFENADRKQRLKDAADWIKAVKEKATGKTDKGDNFFKKP